MTLFSLKWENAAQLTIYIDQLKFEVIKKNENIYNKLTEYNLITNLIA